jgi:uncharacterized protein YdhG (YjbR/CyaY superfamily)
MKADINSVEEYMADYPKGTQELLAQLRATIRKAAPQAEEIISYHMPAYKFHGRLCYFAAYEHHIGFYPMASPIAAFRKEISGYKSAKGSVQFPLDKPLPVKLIAAMIKFKMQENLQKAEIKKIKKIKKK